MWPSIFRMGWDRHQFNENNPTVPVFYIRTLFRFKGWTVRIHKFTAADASGCFHSHPARAWRLILWGGYREEILDFDEHKPIYEDWAPGRFGWITPDFEHRIDKLHNGRSSYSLWIRGPITHKVKTQGCD
jgi:hypothetical protein